MTNSETTTHRESCLLITGASSGIGRAMALELAGRYRLILGGRDAARLEQLQHDCGSPERHLIWRHDLADVEGIAVELSSFLARHDVSVCAYVHSAALLNVLPLRSLTSAMIMDAFRTNVFSAMEIIKTLTKKKVNKNQLSAVVFISSIASKFGAKGFSAYSASKGALDALMKSLAVELAPGVRVNSVLPGAVHTPMTNSIFDDPELIVKFERTYPLGIGRPLDVINAVEFLLSDKARWITGQQIIVDGGRTSDISA